MILRTGGICIAICSWKELKLVPSFSCSSLLLACRSYILIKIEYAVDGEQNGARMKSISRTVSDLRRQEKTYSSSYYEDKC